MGRLKSAEWRFTYLGPPIAILVLISLFLFGWWFADRQQPMEAMTGTFVKWDEKIPRRGHVEWKGIPIRSCPGTVYRYIVDGEIVILPSKPIAYTGPIDNPKREPRTIPVTFDLPERIQHNAAYRVRVEFRCNPLHKYFPIIVAPPDVRFTLGPGMKNDGLLPPGDDTPEFDSQNFRDVE